MSLGERNPGPGLQIAFKSHCTALVGKLDDKIDGPGTVLGCMDAKASIVLCQSPWHIRCRAGVVTRRGFLASQHVDVVLRHEGGESKEAANGSGGPPSLARTNCELWWTSFARGSQSEARLEWQREGWPAIRSSRGLATASEGWYRYGDSNPGPVAENHVS